MWFAETLGVVKSRLGKFRKGKMRTSVEESQLTQGGPELNVLGAGRVSCLPPLQYPCTSAYLA